MVPGPESSRIKLSFIFNKTEQALRLSEGTQVPDPSMVNAAWLRLFADIIFFLPFLQYDVLSIVEVFFHLCGQHDHLIL